MTQTLQIPADLVELIGDAALTVEDLVRCARVTQEWVLAHVLAGAIVPTPGDDTPPTASTLIATHWQAWRFPSTVLVRVRRIAGLERDFDADPQLAALAADLMEEVAWLRGQIHP